MSYTSTDVATFLRRLVGGCRVWARFSKRYRSLRYEQHTILPQFSERGSTPDHMINSRNVMLSILPPLTDMRLVGRCHLTRGPSYSFSAQHFFRFYRADAGRTDSISVPNLSDNDCPAQAQVSRSRSPPKPQAEILPIFW